MEKIGYFLTFLLGVYGGFFSGGYVTTLTATFIGCLNMTFVEAVAITKVLNIFFFSYCYGYFYESRIS